MNLWNFDIIVIGAGPGNYIATIRAAQLGRRWLDSTTGAMRKTARQVAPPKRMGLHSVQRPCCKARMRFERDFAF